MHYLMWIKYIYTDDMYIYGACIFILNKSIGLDTDDIYVLSYAHDTA